MNIFLWLMVGLFTLISYFQLDLLKHIFKPFFSPGGVGMSYVITFFSALSFFFFWKNK